MDSNRKRKENRSIDSPLVELYQISHLASPSYFNFNLSSLMALLYKLSHNATASVSFGSGKSCSFVPLFEHVAIYYKITVFK